MDARDNPAKPADPRFPAAVGNSQVGSIALLLSRNSGAPPPKLRRGELCAPAPFAVKPAEFET